MASVRFSDVASSLGVSSALVVYHFETKENLLAEALRHAAERDLLRLRRIVRSTGSTQERLMSALGWYAPTGRARGWLIWVDAWAASLRDEVLAAVLSDLQEQWTRAIADLIATGVEEGLFVTDDAGAAAARITAMLDGLAVRTVVHGHRRGREQLFGWLTRYTAWELGALPADLEEAVGSSA